MGGVTIAHQPTNEDTNFTNYTTTEEQINQLLAASAEWSANNANMPPIEDLTGEVQELMMRESVNWLQPWGDTACLSDTQMYAQSLEELFGQNQLDFAQAATTALYDELTFVPDDGSLNFSAPTSTASSPDHSVETSPVVQPLQVVEPIIEQHVDIEEVNQQPPLKRRRSSVSTLSSSSEEEDSEDDDSSSSESESDEPVIPTTVANMNSRRAAAAYDSSDDDSDTERPRASTTYMYMHKRQIEETLLDRITNHLDPERLPGILPILMPEQSVNQDEEVEIDLSCLARDQLVQVLSYVDACLLEQQGGPSVNIEDYIQRKKPAVKRRRPKKPVTKTRAELTEEIDADDTLSSSEDEEEEEVTSRPKQEGPISMASLSKKNNTAVPPLRKRKSSNNNKKSTTTTQQRRRRVRKNRDDALVASHVTVFQDPDSIASSRPKRHAAVHKRRLLEDMLAPSDDDEEDDDDAGCPLVVFGDEKMDFAIVDNCTISHDNSSNSSMTTSPVIAAAVPNKTEEILATSAVADEANEASDEEIDIMF